MGGLIHRSGGGGRNENAFGLIVDIGRDMVDDEATTTNVRITIVSLLTGGEHQIDRYPRQPPRQHQVLGQNS